MFHLAVIHVDDVSYIYVGYGIKTHLTVISIFSNNNWLNFILAPLSMIQKKFNHQQVYWLKWEGTNFHISWQIFKSDITGYCLFFNFVGFSIQKWLILNTNQSGLIRMEIWWQLKAFCCAIDIFVLKNAHFNIIPTVYEKVMWWIVICMFRLSEVLHFNCNDFLFWMCFMLCAICEVDIQTKLKSTETNKINI